MDIKSYKLNFNGYRAIPKTRCNQINKDFLASLGAPFLTLIYESIDKDSESVLLLERVNNSIIGFI
jgi:hypothetical protein